MVEAFSPPTILFPESNTGGWQPVNVVVVHSAVMGLYCGSAIDLSHYGDDPALGVSWHYSIDSCQTRQNVWDNTVAWHCGWNYGTLGWEMAEYPSYDLTRWQQSAHRELLRELADGVRQTCLYYDIPMQHRTKDELLAGKRGICGHDDVPGPSTHWDPGAFPWNQFLALVRGEEPGPMHPSEHPTGGGAASGATLPETRDGLQPAAPRDFPLEPGNYFGMITGPAESHGGYYGWEQSYILAIQQELIRSGYVPGISDPQSAWADGIYEMPTHDAVTRFQQAERPDFTTRWGEVWADDWATLLFGVVPELNGTAPDGGNPANPDWPLPHDEWFGYIYAGPSSHGGWYAWEQPYVTKIQRAMISKGYVPGITDPYSSWADGIYGTPTVQAVSRWQREEWDAQTTLYGQVWDIDWKRLFWW